MKLFRMMLIGAVLCGAFGAKLGAFLSLSGVVVNPELSLIEIGLGIGALVGIAGALTISFATSESAKERRSKEVTAKAGAKLVAETAR